MFLSSSVPHIDAHKSVKNNYCLLSEMTKPYVIRLERPCKGKDKSKVFHVLN